MWQVSGASGVSPGTPPTARGDSDRLQSRPGGAMGSEHAPRGSRLPGQAGIPHSLALAHADFGVSRVLEMTCVCI